MAIKIGCTKCGKKISIDEAFAGGVCRCPYCKTINDVPLNSRRSQSGTRAVPTEASQKRIPIAKRASYQGITAVVLFALILIMIVGVILAIVMATRAGGDGGGKTPDQTPTATEVNPFVAGAPSTVAGDIKITTPVVYCIEAGRSMGGFYGDALDMVEASTKTLGLRDRVSIVVAWDDNVRSFESGSVASMLAEAKALDPEGTSPMADAIDEALAMTPETIVILTRQGVALSAAEAIKAEGVDVVVIVLDGIASIDSEMQTFAKAAGGACCSYTSADIEELQDQADKP